MDLVESKPRQPGQSSIEDYPEIPFTPEWGSLVRRSRKTAGLSQTELAERAHITQPMVSYIESGASGSSKAVMPIVEALGCPMPDQYFSDELEQRWVESGRVLRRVNESGFRGLLAAAEQMIANADPQEH